MSPRDWVLKFANIAPVEFMPQAQMIDRQFVDRFVFESAGIKTFIFIDTFTKLPVRIVEESEGSRVQHDYVGLKVGSVSAKDVFH